MTVVKSTDEEISKFIGFSADWVVNDNSLVKEFVFDDFFSAFRFMTKVAMYVEKVEHYPVWYNANNKVTAMLTTQKIDGISKLDIDLANMMDAATIAAFN